MIQKYLSAGFGLVLGLVMRWQINRTNLVTSTITAAFCPPSFAIVMGYSNDRFRIG